MTHRKDGELFYRRIYMPIDYSLPNTIESYFKIIEHLSNLTEGYDSLSKESDIFREEIKYYLNLIREEMKKTIQENQND